MVYDPYSYGGYQSYGSYPYNSGSGQIQQVLAFMQSWGLTDALLPFLLLFSLVFAILQKVKLFTTGEGAAAKPDKKLHGIISFAIAALIVLPHVTGTYPDPRTDPINIINTFLPGAAVLLLVILMVILLTGVINFPNLPVRLAVFGATIILMLTMLFQAFPAFAPAWLIDDPNMQALLIVLLVFGLIIWFITRDDTPSDPNDNLNKKLKRWLGEE